MSESYHRASAMLPLHAFGLLPIRSFLFCLGDFAYSARRGSPDLETFPGGPKLSHGPPFKLISEGKKR